MALVSCVKIFRNFRVIKELLLQLVLLVTNYLFIIMIKQWRGEDRVASHTVV